jgi:hypothetical protein
MANQSTNQSDFLSFKQIVNLIKGVGHKRTVLVMGENGIGKTSIHKALCADPDFADFIKPAPIDCTQLSDGSLFMPDIDRERGVSTELPNERLGISRTNQRGVNGAKPTLIMFDEIAKIPQYVKNMIAPIGYERRAGVFYAPDGSIVIMATNLANEGLGDMLQAHLGNRLIKVKMRKATKEEYFNDFAIPNGMNAMLMACLDEHPEVFDSFLDYEEGGKFHGVNLEKDNPSIFNPHALTPQTAYASLRSLHAASDILDAYELGAFDDRTLESALAGTVGEVYAAKILSYIKFGQQLPSLSSIKANPNTADLPRNKIAQQVLVLKMIGQTRDRDEAQAYVTYVNRLEPELQSLFVRRVSETSTAQYFLTIAEYAKMLADNRIYFKV